MQSRFEMTQGKSTLESILASFPSNSEHWNEAQNRFQFIDRLLMECLGWEQPFITVEVTDDLGGRADYHLGKSVRAVLEAKREAKKFDFLPAAAPSKARKLRALIEGCKELQSAVNQVIPYCTMCGAQIAIVCNGPQMVIFQAHISGMSPLESECYVFDGFDSYLSNFPLLWKLLSPEGIAENRALRELATHRNPRIPAKAFTSLAEPMAYRYRNKFQENLRLLASVLLENIEDDASVKSDFYKECYVALEANNRHLLLSKNIIAARYKRASNNGIAPERIKADVKDGKVELNSESPADITGTHPIVVVGDVGVGKTSFFENLFEKIDESERKNTYYIHLNLGTKATLSKDVKDFILFSIPIILKKTYGINIENANFVESIYKTDLLDFEESLSGRLKEIDPTGYERERIAFLQGKINRAGEHLHTALNHLATAEKKQIILVIDNADQRTFETQQEAFLIAQELASSGKMLVFVSLRPSTFYQSKLTGALSGYQNRVLTISPPPPAEVLRKRITFAVRVAEGKAAPATLEGVHLDIKSIVLFLKATLRSISGNSKIKTFLGNITGGNTRLVIELITGFCGSPNVESERIVRIETEKGDYQVPLHEFTKHALLGEYAYYNPLSSLVACNLFDISAPDPKEHFLGALLIAYISSPMGITDNDGFVPGTSILEELHRLGFSEDQSRFALRRLASKRLIETPHGHYRELDVADTELPDQFHFRATSIGLYHIRHWVGSFAFLDATSIDTPIFDTDTRGIVFENASSFEIKDRYRRAVAFRDYLETKWHDANFQIRYYDFLGTISSEKNSFESVSNFLSKGKTNGNNNSRGRR